MYVTLFAMFRTLLWSIDQLDLAGMISRQQHIGIGQVHDFTGERGKCGCGENLAEVTETLFDIGILVTDGVNFLDQLGCQVALDAGRFFPARRFFLNGLELGKDFTQFLLDTVIIFCSSLFKIRFRSLIEDNGEHVTHTLLRSSQSAGQVIPDSQLHGQFCRRREINTGEIQNRLSGLFSRDHSGQPDWAGFTFDSINGGHQFSFHDPIVIAELVGDRQQVGRLHPQLRGGRLDDSNRGRLIPLGFDVVPLFPVLEPISIFQPQRPATAGNVFFGKRESPGVVNTVTARNRFAGNNRAVVDQQGGVFKWCINDSGHGYFCTDRSDNAAS